MRRYIYMPTRANYISVCSASQLMLRPIHLQIASFIISSSSAFLLFLKEITKQRLGKMKENSRYAYLQWSRSWWMGWAVCVIWFISNPCCVIMFYFSSSSSSFLCLCISLWLARFFFFCCTNDVGKLFLFSTKWK